MHDNNDKDLFVNYSIELTNDFEYSWWWCFWFSWIFI